MTITKTVIILSIIATKSKTQKENSVKIVSEPNLKFENNTKR